MTTKISNQSVVVTGTTTVSLGSLIQTTTGVSDPAYLVLNGFDRDEGTAAASGSTGLFSGSNHSLGLFYTNGDTRESGIVFVYQSASGRYYSNAFGYLDQLSFTTSSSSGDVTDLSLFGFSSLSSASGYANDIYSLMSVDPSGYLGSVTILTAPSFTGPVPTQATPDSIASIAESFVGQSCNMNGCWILASTIAAEAGTSLPAQTTLVTAGEANGEWLVAYNGSANASSNWQSMVHTGDMVAFVTGSGGGHITTCVSGSGNSAMLVDNITYVNGAGTILNLANDGSAQDVTIAAPHLADIEWSGVSASSVVIYRLDTPLVSILPTQLTLDAGDDETLSNLFIASDPAGRPIEQYQVYIDGSSDQLLVAGSGVAAVSAADAITTNSLSDIAVQRGSSADSDVISVRAFNGLFWGDWTTLPASGTANSTTITPSMATISPVTTSTNAEPVYRFFEQANGTHFYTVSTGERNALIASRPDLVYEGAGMNALASTTNDTVAVPVYRFFDHISGTHFFTASATEEVNLIASRPDLSFEGVAFYEDALQRPNDTAVYRFFDRSDGTHLFIASAAERTTILATRPDLVSEGIAFYAPS